MSDLKAILTINIACLEETVLHTEQKLNVSEMVYYFCITLLNFHSELRMFKTRIARGYLVTFLYILILHLYLCRKRKFFLFYYKSHIFY